MMHFSPFCHLFREDGAGELDSGGEVEWRVGYGWDGLSLRKEGAARGWGAKRRGEERGAESRCDTGWRGLRARD